jgi:hypothetical protein
MLAVARLASGRKKQQHGAELVFSQAPRFYFAA